MTLLPSLSIVSFVGLVLALFFMMDITSSGTKEFLASLIGGGLAGLCVDVSLFPLDTIKTRLQSKGGFLKAGGFAGVYAGLGSAAAGSIPGAALFFCSYDTTKRYLSAQVQSAGLVWAEPLVQMTAASVGEIMACIVRVPVEVVKQRAQSTAGLTSYAVLSQTLSSEGFRGLYRGYLSTVAREIPFSLIQFPLWEGCKGALASLQDIPQVPAWQAALVGAFAGMTAASFTTPIDVAKTRIMTAERHSKVAKMGVVECITSIQKDEGYGALFKGITPRTLWIGIGGFVFLGVYQKASNVLLETL